MKKGIRNLIVLATAVFGLTLTACGSGNQVDLSTVTPDQIQAYASALTPAQLQAYTAALTPAQIQTIGGSLTFAQLQAIAPFLALVTGSTSGTTVTPESLYASNCAGCHGPLATSSKLGATLARTQSAISNNIGGMGYLSNSLTINQMQAITTALTATTPGTGTGGGTTANGTALYATNCANCHGTLASSGKLGTTAARTQSAINGNVGGMGYLSTLNAAEVQAIATSLAVTGTGGGTTGGTSTGHPSNWTNPESSHRNYVEDNGTAGCVSCHSIDQSSKGQPRSCYNCHGNEWGDSGGDDD